MIVLRLLHVVGGLFWAGSSLYVAWFLQPSVQATGQAGGTFVKHLMGETKLPIALGVSAVSTLVSGVLLYWHDFGAIVPFSASMGGFALGGVAGIAAWLVGVSVLLPSGQRIEALGARAGAGEDVGAEMARTSARMSRYGQVASWSMVLAVVCMAVARYL